ncbi:hypothetical protein [Streptomyces sp. NPDC059597]|uniref:hypothetical protein n=1 Tax=Streptomyces sp. NPDC059597 TaxID=3346879 RepID=UPI00368F66EB
MSEPMTPEREAEIRSLDLLSMVNDRAAPVISGYLAALLREVDRLRARVAELERWTDDLDFLERITLPGLRREVQHHKDSKQRWRKRAETAEARLAELEAERHSTNEALSDAAEALREQRDRIAELEAQLKPKPKNDPSACGACGSPPKDWCPDCAACQQGCFGGNDDNPCTHPNARWKRPSAEESADKLTRLFAPTQALREDPHDSPLHHTYQLGRDLPEVNR